MSENILQSILDLEYQISDLNITKNKLGKEYIKKNCPFKIGDKVIIAYNGKTIRGEIFKIEFNSHSNIEGLANIGVYQINKKGNRMISVKPMLFSEVNSITKIIK